MFAGFSLVKKLENVSLAGNNSRTLYTADFECFAIAFLRNTYNTGVIANSILYTESHLARYCLNKLGQPGLYPQSDIGHIRQGGSLIWRAGFRGYTADIYIYRTLS